jgi:hypothetical protein
MIPKVTNRKKALGQKTVATIPTVATRLPTITVMRYPNLLVMMLLMGPVKEERR